jgi:hypothetical protein
LKRLEANLLLAVSAGLTLLLIVISATAYGPPIGTVRNPLLAVLCTLGFLLLNPMLRKRMGQPPQPPMINPRTPGTAVWAGLFPLIMTGLAAVPVFWPGPDYALLVIIGAVMFAVTLQSALTARREG